MKPPTYTELAQDSFYAALEELRFIHDQAQADKENYESICVRDEVLEAATKTNTENPETIAHFTEMLRKHEHLALSYSWEPDDERTYEPKGWVVVATEQDERMLFRASMRWGEGKDYVLDSRGLAEEAGITHRDTPITAVEKFASWIVQDDALRCCNCYHAFEEELDYTWKPTSQAERSYIIELVKHNAKREMK